MAKGHKGKPHGMNYADVIARKHQIAAAINAAARDNSVRLQADVRCQRQLWLCVIALNERQMQEAAELAKKDGVHLDPMEI